MTRVILQAGHSAAYVPYAQNGGGAPGEADWTTRLAAAIGARLQARGVEIDLVGAWLVYRNAAVVELAAPLEAMAHADLFVSLHYDASGVYPQNTGCFAGRAALDPKGADADRFIRIWEGLYPAATGIPLHKERLGVSVTDYYGFRATSDETPGVLIEHGIGQGDDHALLFDHLDLVAAADTLAITQFLGLEDEDDVSLRDENARLMQELQAATAERDQLQGVNKTLGEQLAEKDRLLQQANSRVGALTHDVLEPLQDQLEGLRRQLDLAAHRSAREVVVVLDDGTSQRFAPTPAIGG